MKIFVWLGLLFGFFIPDVSAKVLDITDFELNNGLKVLVIENHRAPVIKQLLLYKAGSNNDVFGKKGTAHLLEHLMFRGTKNIKDGEFSALSERNGVQHNAYTTFEETGYYEFADISKLELIMAMEADRMVELDIQKEAFLKERDIVFQERKERFETKPSTFFYEQLMRSLWQNHPLSTLPSGTTEDINNLKIEDVVAFYQEYYQPHNAILVLSGDIKIDEAKRLVQTYYGKLKNKRAIDTLNVSVPRAFDGDFLFKLDGIKQERFDYYIRLDKAMLDKKEQLVLAVLLEYLSGDDTSFMDNKLVYEDKKLLSIGVGSSYSSSFGGTISFSVVPVNKHATARELKDIILETAKLGVSKFDEIELNKIIRKIKNDTIYLADNPELAADFVSHLFIKGFNVAEIRDYDKLFDDITVEDVKNLFLKLMNVQARVSGYLKGTQDEE